MLRTVRPHYTICLRTQSVFRNRDFARLKRSSPVRFSIHNFHVEENVYPHIERGQPGRKSGTVTEVCSQASDTYVLILEDTSKDTYSWLAWPRNFHGVRGVPLLVGDRVTFRIQDEKIFRIHRLLLEKTGDPPILMGEPIWH